MVTTQRKFQIEADGGDGDIVRVSMNTRSRFGQIGLCLDYINRQPTGYGVYEVEFDDGATVMFSANELELAHDERS